MTGIEPAWPDWKSDVLAAVLHLQNGEDGIRTHVPKGTNGFQDRLVMAASIPLQSRAFGFVRTRPLRGLPDALIVIRSVVIERLHADTSYKHRMQQMGIEHTSTRLKVVRSSVKLLLQNAYPAQSWHRGFRSEDPPWKIGSLLRWMDIACRTRPSPLLFRSNFLRSQPPSSNTTLSDNRSWPW